MNSYFTSNTKHFNRFDASSRGQGYIIAYPDLFSNQSEPYISFKLLNEKFQGLFIEITAHTLYLSYKCNEKNEISRKIDDSNLGTGRNEQCLYWIRLFGTELVYGKGEVREKTALIRFHLPDEDKTLIQTLELWLVNGSVLKADHYPLDHYSSSYIERPSFLTSKPTMPEVAENSFLNPYALTNECKELYHWVQSENLILNDKDFPDFSKAIEQSITHKEGWCYKKLEEKAKHTGDKKATYLRITMGNEEGRSPGIPYVLEVWPIGHYSSIHRHAEANAIIKVLHGKVTVELYRALSVGHQTPFSASSISKGDITWITPDLNQTHRLINNEGNTCCITVQCYLYPKKKDQYEFFDYINKGKEINQFAPKSDCTYKDFRKHMEEEWSLGTTQYVESKSLDDRLKDLEEFNNLIEGHDIQEQIFKILYPGLCIEGKCSNTKCKAYERMVVVNKYMGEYNPFEQEHENRCPLCNGYIKTIYYAVNRCIYRTEGIKQPDDITPPQEIKTLDTEEKSYKRINFESWVQIKRSVTSSKYPIKVNLKENNS